MRLLARFNIDLGDAYKKKAEGQEMNGKKRMLLNKAIEQYSKTLIILDPYQLEIDFQSSQRNKALHMG